MTALDPLEDGRQKFEVKLWEFVKANNCRTLDERVRVEQLVQLFGAAWTARAVREREVHELSNGYWCCGQHASHHDREECLECHRINLAALSETQPQEGK